MIVQYTHCDTVSLFTQLISPDLKMTQSIVNIETFNNKAVSDNRLIVASFRTFTCALKKQVACLTCMTGYTEQLMHYYSVLKMDHDSDWYTEYGYEKVADISYLSMRWLWWWYRHDCSRESMITQCQMIMRMSHANDDASTKTCNLCSGSMATMKQLLLHNY